MKCIVLVENTSCREDLMCEHGLSLWLETKQHTILFDSGQSDLFYENACKLNLDLNQVDICILSHGHYDHAGGLKKFLEVNHHARIYMHRKAFESHWHGYDKDIGIDPDLMNHEQVLLIDDTVQLNETLKLIPCERHEPVVSIQSHGLYVKKNDEFVPELFEHEIVLSIKEEKEFLLSGCTHSGILNVMHWFQPDVLIGGFHLKKVDPETQSNELIELAEQLKCYDTVYYTGHCTGDKQFEVLHQVLGDQLHTISTGQSLTIE